MVACLVRMEHASVGRALHTWRSAVLAHERAEAVDISKAQMAAELRDVKAAIARENKARAVRLMQRCKGRMRSLQLTRA